MNKEVVVQNHEVASPCIRDQESILVDVPLDKTSQENGTSVSSSNRTIQLFGYKNTAKQPAYTCILTDTLEKNPAMLNIANASRIRWYLTKTAMYYFDLHFYSITTMATVARICVDKEGRIKNFDLSSLGRSNLFTAACAQYFDQFIGYQFRYPTHANPKKDLSKGGIDRVYNGTSIFDEKERKQ